MKAYSPFDKPIQDLQTSDLTSLKQATEGWYIEYKREPPSASAIAKSLSAFANTYGGWFFIGIDEESKENPVAGSFIGIEKGDMDGVLQCMRKSAADHINPTPYFQTKVLWGPADEIGLSKNRGIICAWLPRSVNAPHVHKSGVIYRRVADASEPKAENDRFVLDQLWRRGDEVKRQYKDWYDRDPEFSEQEKQLPYIRLMLVADRWTGRDIWFDADEDQVRSILSGDNNRVSIPFDTVYTSAQGFVGRQLNGNDPNNLSLTWRLGRNLVSDIIIPLPLYQVETITQLVTELNGYDHIEQFGRILSKYSVSKLRIIDLNLILNILIGIADIQEKLCKLAGWSDSYYFKVKVLNAWRTIPFIDTSPILDRFEKYGPPMCLDSLVTSPLGINPESYSEVSTFSEIETDARLMVQAFVMFSRLALAFGIPPWIELEGEVNSLPYFQNLQDACQRAINAQHLRNERLKSQI